MNLLNLTNIVPDKTSQRCVFATACIRHNPRNCANGHAMKIDLHDKGDKGGCCEEVGLRKGTWLAHFNLSYRKVVLFIYCWSREMTSRDFCERKLEIYKKPVVDWNNFLREVFAAELIANPIAIGGPNTTVKVDESFFASRKNHQGRNLPQQ